MNIITMAAITKIATAHATIVCGGTLLLYVGRSIIGQNKLGLYNTLKMKAKYIIYIIAQGMPIKNGQIVKVQHITEKREVFYVVGSVICISKNRNRICVKSNQIVPCDIPGHSHRNVSKDSYIYKFKTHQIFIPHYNPVDRLANIQAIFSTMTFAKVMKMNLDSENVKNINIYSFGGKHGTSEALEYSQPISLEPHTGLNKQFFYKKNTLDVRVGYSYYYGFVSLIEDYHNVEHTNSRIRADDDEPSSAGILNVQFRKGYRPMPSDTNIRIANIFNTYFNLTDLTKIGMWEHNSDAEEPPGINNLICGIKERINRNKYRFKKWFVCSKQFYRLWTLIMYGDQHHMFENKNKKQILDMLETNRRLKIIEPPAETRKNYKRVFTEPASKKYVDIYKAIAHVYYYNEDIPDHYYIPNADSKKYQKALLNTF